MFRLYQVNYSPPNAHLRLKWEFPNSSRLRYTFVSCSRLTSSPKALLPVVPTVVYFLIITHAINITDYRDGRFLAKNVKIYFENEKIF